MTYLDRDVGARQHGATRVTRRAANPVAILRSLMDSAANVHLREERVEICDQCADEILADREMVKAVVEYWCQNAYKSLLRDYPVPGAPTREQQAGAKQKRVEELRAGVVKAAAAAAQVMLLDLGMPNGKALRDCTGSECRMMGRGLERIANAIRPRQKVGDVLNEAAVRMLYKAA